MDALVAKRQVCVLLVPCCELGMVQWLARTLATAEGLQGKGLHEGVENEIQGVGSHMLWWRWVMSAWSSEWKVLQEAPDLTKVRPVLYCTG